MAKKKPRNVDLPGMGDRTISPLDEVAVAYAEVRDERMTLNQREVDLKAQAMRLMKKYQKEIYRHDGIEIRVIPGVEDIKVKVRKPDDEDPPEQEPAEPVA